MKIGYVNKIFDIGNLPYLSKIFWKSIGTIFFICFKIYILYDNVCFLCFSKERKHFLGRNISPIAICYKWFMVSIENIFN